MVTSEKERAATAAHQSYLPVQDAESKSWLEATFWFDLEVFISRIASLLCYTQHLINPAALGTKYEWDPLFSHLPSNLLRPHCLPVPWLHSAPIFVLWSQIYLSSSHLSQPFLFLPSQNDAHFREKEQHVAYARKRPSSFHLILGRDAKRLLWRHWRALPDPKADLASLSTPEAAK